MAISADFRPARVRDQGRATAEMGRLSRRRPALDGQQPGRAEPALARVNERLVLAGASAVNGEELMVLFDLAGVP